jgi:hypothetical protein
MASPEHLEILRQGVEAWNKWRIDHPLINPDFSGSDLHGENFDGINFVGANLSDAALHQATFGGGDLGWANLSGANLREADLGGANLSWADLTGVDLTGAGIGPTVFASNNLSVVKGLETVSHFAPSTIGVDTLYKSHGNIPEEFMRGCGLPDEFITYARSLVGGAQAIQFYSCFISYSSKNHVFADRLYTDLQEKGVRCWLASKDLKIGDKIRERIDESIRLHDKLLLVLSKYSVASDWVEQEVETALDRERKEKRTILFPIRLDDIVMMINSGWPALVKNTRNIGDFRTWRNAEAYQNAFNRLLHDLKAESSSLTIDFIK